MPGAHKHPQRANKSVVSAYTHAEMSLSTLKGKGHFGQNFNMWSQKHGVTKKRNALPWLGIPEQGLHF